VIAPPITTPPLRSASLLPWLVGQTLSYIKGKLVRI
jgi:hypothetical protein